MGKRYWEDLVEGERFTCRPVAFDREGIVAFGTEYDPLPFHLEGETARRSIFGDVIASALHTISACTRVVVEAHGEIAILSGLSIDEIRTFTFPVVRLEDLSPLLVGAMAIAVRRPDGTVLLKDEKTQKEITNAQITMKVIDPKGQDQIKSLQYEDAMKSYDAYFKLPDKGKYQVIMLFKIGEQKRTAGIYYEIK